jgi:DNA-binding NarL/FixJ family response regulator
VNNDDRPGGALAHPVTRVMIVDDDEFLREILAALFAAEPDMEVVAACSDGQEAVNTITSANPDVVVMDLLMPGLDGAAAVVQILRISPDVRILLFTASPDHPRVTDAVAAGAAQVLRKSGDPRALLAAIRSVAVQDSTERADTSLR